MQPVRTGSVAAVMQLRATPSCQENALVALNLDTARPLRSPKQLLSLVEAVYTADPTDEKPYLEWKSALPLGKTDKESHAAIGRCIIGMANRIPAIAAAHLGGCGYMVIGVEPGTVHGVTVPDPADFEDWVNRYAGNDGPVWSLDTVTFHDATVLVITTDPPAAGDRIHTMQAQIGKWEAGAIYVRKLGRTEKATPADIRALEDRLIAGTTTGPARLEELDVQPTQAMCVQVIDWSKDREDAAVRNAEAALPPLPAPNARTTSIGGLTIPNINYVSEDAARQYRSEITAYLTQYREVAPRAAVQQAVEMHDGAFAVQLVNGSDVALEDVQVRIVLPTALRAFADPSDIDVELPETPDPPRAAWDSSISSPLFTQGLHYPMTSPQIAFASPRIRVRGHEVTLLVPLIHPYDSETTEAFVLIAPLHTLGGADPADAQWEAEVTVTARNRAGAVRSTLTLQSLGPAIGMDTLLLP